MTPTRFRRLCAIVDRRQPDLTVLMDNVHKPHNVSAVVRTCDAVGVLTAHAVTPAERFQSIPRSASGSDKWVPVQTHADHPHAFAALHAQGMQVVAAHLDTTARDFRAIDYTRPTAILMGAELDGVSGDALGRVDSTITIPMAGAVESLNVSVAAAVILYEAQRQREAAGRYDTCQLTPEARHRWLFEHAHPRIAALYRDKGLPYPALSEDGDVLS